MKAILFTKLQTFCVRMSILLMGLLPFSTRAQNGQNDPTFNKTDKIAGQGTNNVVEVSALQPDGKIIIAGEFMYYNGVGRTKIVRIKPDGSLDNSFNARGATMGKINAIAVLPNNKILVAGNFTAFDGFATNGIVRLNANGSVDKTFIAGLGTHKGLYKICIQQDGKIILAGNFFPYNYPFATGLVRLNKNGSADNSFHPVSGPLVDIQQIQLQPDGKILLAGTELIGTSADYCGVIRLNQNGDKDTTFNKYTITFGDYRQYINSLNIEQDGAILVGSAVYAEDRVYKGSLRRLDTNGNEIGYMDSFWMNSTLVQPDGKILVIGFKYIDSDILWYILKRSIVRLNKDLTIDSTYEFDDKKIYSYDGDARIATALLQIDGKIIIGGDFSETCGLITNNIARLNTNGSLDLTFNQHKGSNGALLATAVQADEKIVIGGEFSRYNYQFISNVARLKKNGELDFSFQTGSGPNGRVHTIAIQPNGKILIGGNFTSYNGHTCGNIARLNRNGSYDESFAGITADNVVRKIGIDRNGRIIITGDFKTVNGISKPAIARILSNGTLDNSFHVPITNPNSMGIMGGYDFAISTRGQIYFSLIFKSHVFQTIGTNLLRLNRNGSIDSTFKIPEQEFYEIQTIVLNNDGKPLIAGLAGNEIYSSGFVAQLNADGSLDSTFHYKDLKSHLNNTVRTITVLENDKLIIGGDFAKSVSTLFDHITFLNKDGSFEIGEDVYIHADNAVYTATRNANAQLIIGGTFGEYNTAVRNGIARINIEVPFDSRLSQPAISSVQSDDEHLSLYPNPAASSIHIENLKPGSQFKIFNTIGKEVYSGKWTNENGTIELSDYLNGIYFIVTEADGKRTVNKFIVSK